MKVFDELSPGANWAPTCCPIAVVLRQASRRRVFPKLDRDRLFSDFSALETARLTLRSLAPEDAEDVFRLLSDPLVAQHQEWDPLGSIADATRFLSERLDLFQRRLRMHWGLALKREGFLVGQVGMHSMSFRDRRAELAFDLRSDY